MAAQHAGTETGAVFIPPDPDMSPEMDNILRVLGDGLCRRMVIKNLRKQAENDSVLQYPSVRFITGDRLECFIAKGHQASISKAIPNLPKGWQKHLVQYASKQASKDPRVRKHTNIVFHGFSIILGCSQH